MRCQVSCWFNPLTSLRYLDTPFRFQTLPAKLLQENQVSQRTTPVQFSALNDWTADIAIF